MTEYDMPPGWYLDPSEQGEARYWNGTMWTATVSRDGETVNVPIDPTYATVVPAPGTEVHLPIPVSRYTLDAPPKRSPIMAILGVMVVAIIVIALVVALRDDSSSDDDPPPTNPPPATAPAETDPPSNDGG